MSLRPLALAALLISLTPAIARASDAPHAAPPDSVDADAALATLKAGNARFIAGESMFPRLDQDRRCETTEGGQHPIVSILSCADSRVPPELIFDAGLGDLFVIRVAGNIAATDEIGTLEYGAGHLGTRLVVVMGHAKCGAVTAVVKGAHVGPNIAKLVAPIAPAVEDARLAGHGASEQRLVTLAIKANVRRAMRDVLTRSDDIRALVAGGKVKIVGAVYDIHNGTIEWLGEHPEQAALLESPAAHDEPAVAAAHAAADSIAHAAPSHDPHAAPTASAHVTHDDDGHDAKLAAHHPTPTKATAEPDQGDAHTTPAAAAPKPRAAHDDVHGDASSPDAHGQKNTRGQKDTHGTNDAHGGGDAHSSAAASHGDASGRADASGHEADEHATAGPTLMQRQGLLLPAAFLMAGSALSGSVVYVMTRNARPAAAPPAAHAEPAAH